MLSIWRTAHDPQSFFHLVFWQNQDQFSLVCQVEGIQPQQFAGLPYGFIDWDGLFIQLDINLALARDLHQSGRKTAASGVPQDMDVQIRSQKSLYQPVEWGGVGAHLAGKAQVGAGLRHGNAMIANRTGYDDSISGFCLFATDPKTAFCPTEAGGADEELVGFAFFGDFGICRD